MTTEKNGLEPALAEALAQYILVQRPSDLPRSWMARLLLGDGGVLFVGDYRALVVWPTEDRTQVFYCRIMDLPHGARAKRYEATKSLQEEDGSWLWSFGTANRDDTIGDIFFYEPSSGPLAGEAQALAVEDLLGTEDFIKGWRACESAKA